MEIVKAELTDIKRLAELNKHLIEDERHPNPMNITDDIEISLMLSYRNRVVLTGSAVQ